VAFGACSAAPIPPRPTGRNSPPPADRARPGAAPGQHRWPKRDLVGTWAYAFERWGAAKADDCLSKLRAACGRIADGSAQASRLAFRGDALFELRQGRHLLISRLAARRL
jgi:plasmid stabilization system protein ParE